MGDLKQAPTTPGLSFDFAALPPAARYKLLTGLVVPRPIALVTTISPAGVVNAAPFSFFNTFAQEPPLLVLGMDARPGGEMKDTLANIRQNRAFVVHLVDEDSARDMNDCAIDFPSAIGEPAALGLALAPGTHGPVPRLSAAPVAMECRQVTTLNFGPMRDLVIGEVLALHTRAGIIDADTLRTDYEVFKPIGRLGGTFYSFQNQRFSMERESYAAYAARTKAAAPEDGPA